MNREPIEGYSFEPEDIVEDADDAEWKTDQEDSEGELSTVSRLNDMTWCECGHCDLMPTFVESTCCSENTAVSTKMKHDTRCVTELQTFSNSCLDADMLEILMASMKEVRRESLRDSITNRMYRYVAYRSFTWWIYGKLGRRRRKVIPACVVTSIRKRFPEKDGFYEGYHEVLGGPMDGHENL